jgi:hypothetical protein
VEVDDSWALNQDNVQSREKISSIIPLHILKKQSPCSVPKMQFPFKMPDNRGFDAYQCLSLNPW